MAPSKLYGESIRDLEAIAARLLTTATQDAMKEQVRLATRDLLEARVWLTQPGIDCSRSLLTIVQTTIDLARARLHGVSDALGKDGPDASMFR